MNAPIKPPQASRERTAQEQADVVLFWHDSAALTAGQTRRSPDELDRSAAGQLESARRVAREALTYQDPDLQLALLRAAGRYAYEATVARARAKELRG